MDLVSQFIENYKKKIPFYESAGRLAAAQLESILQSAGIRAMVTSRAKNPDRHLQPPSFSCRIKTKQKVQIG